MKNNNVYLKLDNGRYKAFGVCCEPEHMSDGIWYVQHHDYSRSTTSVPYIAGMFKVGDASEIDVPTLCGMEKLCNKIFDSDIYRDIVNSGSYSLNDIVHACVRVMYDEAKKEK